jgi:hypothetical protein
MRLPKTLEAHDCGTRSPPGHEIYRSANISVFEVDGVDHKVCVFPYCFECAPSHQLYLSYLFSLRYFLFLRSLISLPLECIALGWPVVHESTGAPPLPLWVGLAVLCSNVCYHGCSVIDLII